MSRLGACKDIADVVSWGLCCGCGMCAAACPRENVLSMQERDRMDVPVVSRPEMCIRCGLCGDVCTAWAHLEGRHAVFRSADEPFEAAFVGAARGRARATGASGGIVSSLLCHLLDEGVVDGVVTTGFDPDRPTHARAYVARSRAEILRGTRSKYQMTTLAPALTECLSRPGRYAVVGLPCQIEAVHNAAACSRKVADRAVLKIAIFCGHNVTRRMTDVLLDEMGLSPEQVRAVDYRSGGWRRFGFAAVDRTGREHFLSMADASPYRDLWEGLHFCPTACTLCPDFTGVFADLSCGDAWLPELAENGGGHSLVLCRTRTGRRMLDSAVAAETISLQPADSIALWRSNAKQIAYKKARLKARLALHRLLSRTPTPALLGRQRGSPWYLPSAAWTRAWTWLVETAHRRGKGHWIAPRLLTAGRNLRFSLEAREDRLAKTSVLLSAYAGENGARP